MRLIGRLAVATGSLMLASACSDGSGLENVPPVAAFTHSCNASDCTFTSTSTDAAPGTIAGYAWTFGDGASANVNNPSHSYSVTAPTDFTVTLTVTDDDGATDVESQTVTVSAAANTPPMAGFTYTCNAADCTFISTSSDAAPGTIATYAWTFGDGGTADVSNPSHSYAVTTPTDFSVTLRVTDNQGATDEETQTVSVAPGVNTPPTAGFTYTCNATDCSFTSTSTDAAPGTIVSYAWNFGDAGTSDVMNPLHSYAVTGSTDFTVTLTVTDNAGATDVETQTVSVSPAPPMAEGCVTDGTRVECAFNVPARSTMKVKLLAVSCDLPFQRLTAPPPVGDQIFLNLCERTAGQEIGIFGGPLDELIIYEAGSQVRLRFNQGKPADGAPLGPPAAHWEGTFPDWTISFEDGDHAGLPGEPDFTDVVVGLHATLK